VDFLKILKSFEEFVYEALTWIVLLPRTLARIILHPRRMSDYAAAELARADDARFSDAVSPPLLLILCVLIAHFVDLGIRTQAPDDSGSLASKLLASEQNLLLYRTIAFGIWALAGAACFLASVGMPVNRESLRVPFYEQCYLVSPFALLLSVSASLGLQESAHATLAAGCLALGGFAWFWFVQVDWIRRKAGLSPWRGVAAATFIVLAGSLANGLVGHVLSNTGTASGAIECADCAHPAPHPAAR
jgi:hypothetical protein